MTAIRWQETLVDDATTDDTLRAIIATVRVYRNSEFVHTAVKEINAKCVRDGHLPLPDDKLCFIKNLFEWVCRNHDYKLDPLGNEIIRTPDLTVRLKNADCKKYAILLGSILADAGIEPIFKHVTYKDEPDFTHIYVLVKAKEIEPTQHLHTNDLHQRHNYFVLDPTNYCKFNDEVKYHTGTLYFINGDTMKLTMMGWNTTERQTPHGKWGNLSDVGNCAAQVLDQAENATTGKLHFPHINLKWHLPPMPHLHAPAILQHVLKVEPTSKQFLSTKHIDLAQQRGAFLDLVKRNYHGMANDLLNLVAKKPEALNELWHNTGGSIDELKLSILEGSKRPKIFSSPEDFEVTAEEKQHGLARVTSLAPKIGSMEPIDTTRYSSAAGLPIGKKGWLKHLLHAAANVLHAVAPIANAIIPGAGAALNHVANGADRLAGDLPEKKSDVPGKLIPSPTADIVPYDNNGVKNIPKEGMFAPQGGNLTGTPLGFFMWACFDSMALAQNHTLLHHFSATVITTVGFVIGIAGATIFTFFKSNK